MKDLRRTLRHRRGALTDQEQAAAAEGLSAQLAHHPALQSASTIAAYLPFDGEISPLPVMDYWHAAGKSVYLPIVLPGDELAFRVWHPDARLSKNRFGIPEPDGEDTPAREMDVILVPLVGFDAAGNRLGMGKGFYDRTLSGAGSRPQLIGLAHDCQETDLVPAPWDVPVDMIATGTRLITCQIPRT